MVCLEMGSTSNGRPDSAYHMPLPEFRSPAHGHGSAGAHLSHRLDHESPPGPRRPPEFSRPVAGGSSCTSRERPSRLSAGTSRTRAAVRGLGAGLPLVVAGLLGVSVAAQAQIYVSNIGQTLDTGSRPVGVVSGFRYTEAQPFTTGDNADGYTLSEVVVKVKSDVDSNDVPRVSIYTSSSGNPGTSLHTLTNPGSFGNGDMTFTAPPNATLAKETDYFVVFEETVGFWRLSATTSDSEGTAETEWSIGDGHVVRNQDTGSWTSESLNRSLLITIKGPLATVPGAPTSLTATASGATTIDLDWTAPSDNSGASITGYKIEVSLDDGSTWTDLAANTNITTTTYSHTGLTAGNTRHYRVSAINSVGASAASNVANATTTAPAIVTDGVRATSMPLADDTYRLGETIEITVTFDDAVTVDTSGGTPRIQFRLDGAQNRWAEYSSGSRGTALKFTYTVQLGDKDDNGIWLPENSLELQSGTIQAAGDNTVAATLTYAEPGLQDLHKVDGSPAIVTDGVRATSMPLADGTYGLGETIAITVTFNTAVTVDTSGGMPRIQLRLDGAENRWADYSSGSGSTDLVFTYDVQSGDMDDNGFWLVGNFLQLQGGTISAVADDTVAATLTYADAGRQDGHKVDGRSSDATLSALALSGVTLAPTFVSSTETYTATVVNSVMQTTVTATRTHSGATVAFKDGGDNALTNPVTLAVGANVIKAEVTAENTTTMKTYMVTVTREGTTNNDPTFPSPTADRSVAENTSAGQNVGAVLTATDDDDDSLTYTLEGTDAASFDLVTTSGSARIRTKSGVTYNYEAKSTYTVVVKADDGRGGTAATVTVTITVTDVNEPPGRPEAPSVSSVAGSTTSLDVTWTVPANTGPDIDNYDLRYRAGTSGGWTNGPKDVDGTSATIMSLTANTLYQVQVLATNDEGDSSWSPAGSGRTNTAGNTVPMIFANEMFTLYENTSAGQNVGPRVTATDADNDPLTFTLEGTDAASFDLVTLPESARLHTKTGVTYNYETKSSYSVIVKVDDGNGGTDTAAVTINVFNVAEPPLAPGAPTVTATPNTTESLTVSWSAPSNTGRPAITSYDLQYREGTSGGWTNGPRTVTGTSATIMGLTADLPAYQVQVRATNSDGDGPWSPPGRIRTTPPQPPRRVVVRPTALTVAEGESGEYTVVLTRRPTGPVEIELTVSGSPDVTAVPVSLTFTASDWNEPQTVTVSAAHDGDALDDAATISHTVSGGGYGSVTASSVAVTVTEDETESTEVLLTLSPAVVSEGAGSAGETVTVTGTLNSGTRAGATAVTMTVAGGTAIEGDDFTPVPDFTLTIPADSTSGTTTFTLVPVDDDVDEDDETVTVTGTTTSGLTVTPASIAITDDEDAPALSAADAEGSEDGGSIAFTVTLGGASSKAVTVDWETSDGTATAGRDYEAASGTLTFAPHQTERLVIVRVLDDAVDEAEERFSLRLSNPVNAELGDAEAVGTIVAGRDGLPKAWLARFGRTAAGHVLDAVGERLRSTRGAVLAETAANGLEVTVAGRRLGPTLDGAGQDGLAAPSRWMPEETGLEASAAGPAEGARQPSRRDLLSNSAFRYTAQAGSDGTWSLWGGGAFSRFDGREEDVALDGEVLTGTVGIDFARNRWLTGLVLSRSRGDGVFSSSSSRGDLESSLTGLYPYLRYQASRRVSVWGLGGYGKGKQALATELQTDMAMTMTAAGIRGELLSPTDGRGLSLALATDALWLRATSDAVESVLAAEAEVSRLRLRIEGSYGGSLAPTFEVGVRQDAGDAETGFGLEVGGGLRYAARGLTANLGVRGLVAHEDQDFREQGVVGSIIYDPNPSSDLGLSFALSPSWGAAASSGVGTDALWARETMNGMAGTDAHRPGGRLDAELGYGVAVFGGRGVVTPYTGLAVSENGRRDLHLGWRLNCGSYCNLMLGLKRPESAIRNMLNEYSVMLQARLEGNPVSELYSLGRSALDRR